MVREIIDFVYVFVSPLIFFASLELIFLIANLRATLNKDIFPSMRTAWIGALLTMLLVTLSQLFLEIFALPSLEKVLELLTAIVFVFTMFIVRQRIASIHVIKEATQRLETALDERTKELKIAKNKVEDYAKNLESLVDERTKELQKTIEDLTATKSALLNLMEDYEGTNVELKKALTELREIDKMKDELISNVSHELRTPITIIKSSIELLVEDAKDDAQKKLLLMALTNANRLNFLIGELLFFTKSEKIIPASEVEEIEISSVINSVLGDMQYYAKEKNLVMKAELPETLPKIEGSREKITQVFVNLIANAVKFNKEKGSVMVRASYKKGEGIVNFAVSDTGIGISPEKIDKIFQRFYQIDGSITRKYGGVGLGLSIVKSIVELHGGRIWVESEVGKGTTFHFTLPLKLKKEYVVKLGM